MRKVAIVFVFLLAVLTACNAEPEAKVDADTTESTKSPQKEQKADEQEKKNEETGSGIDFEQTKLVTSEFEPMLQAIEEKDLEKFMTYQNKDNPLFYKEQMRWFEEIQFKREQNFYVDVTIGKVSLSDLEHGTMELLVNMAPQGGFAYKSKGTYTIYKEDDGWKMDEVEFEKVNDGMISVYYMAGLETDAAAILQDSSKIITLYGKEFNWKPEHEIVIKLYDSYEQIAASVPWTQLSGWNEVGESLKIAIVKNDTMPSHGYLSTLSHELTHKVLSDLTNDNASLYLQEGFATYLSILVTKNSDDQLSFSQQMIPATKERIFSSNEFSFKSMDELMQSTYMDGFALYDQGFLLVEYLMTTYGKEQFMQLAKELKSSPFVDQRAEHKQELITEQTSKAIEKVYGPANQLSEDYKQYYSTYLKE